MNPIQNPLFKEPVGMTFKAKREHMGLSVEEVAKSLKFGTHLVQAIEAEQWEKLGPAVYANSYLNSYIKFLGINEEIRNEIPRLKGEPALKTISTEKIVPIGSLPKKILAFITVGGLVALSIFLYSRYQPVEVVTEANTLSMSAAMPQEALQSKNPIIQSTVPSETLSTATELTSAIASETSPAMLANGEMSISTSQEAWMQVRDSQNAVIFEELIPANQERTHSIKNVGKITIGNASNVKISINGIDLSLTPFIINDVARFTFDSSGKATTLTQ